MRERGVEVTQMSQHTPKLWFAKRMREMLSDGTTTAAEVVARWEVGDLAEAIRDLDRWASDARALLKEIEE